MIKKSDWLNSIEEFLEELSDEEFQRRVWVRGEGPEVSSYTELMCGLFDDFSFDAFLDESWEDFGFTELLHTMLINVRDLLNDYSANSPQLDSEIVDDPAWREISAFGLAALSRFRYERGLKTE